MWQSTVPSGSFVVFCHVLSVSVSVLRLRLCLSRTHIHTTCARLCNLRRSLVNSLIQFYSCFRPTWLDEPDAYKPDRWREDDPMIDRLKAEVFPFSLGRRNCIGQAHAQFQVEAVVREKSMVTSATLCVF